MKENTKERLHEVMERLDKTFKSKLNEDSPYNDGGEPIMTHQQYNRYSEPAEPDEDRNDNNNFSEFEYLESELRKMNLFLETFDGKEYFIRTKPTTNFDFIIYPHGDTFDVYIGDNENKDIELAGVIEIVAQHKDMFLLYDEAARNREAEEKIDTEEHRWKGIAESTDNINPRYTHFAVLNDSGLIVNGWDYSDVSKEDLHNLKNEYFGMDLKDMEIKPSSVKVTTAENLKKKGINPFEYSSWRTDK